MIKDLYFILFIISLLAYYSFRILNLKNEIFKEREFFLNTLKHDIKVSNIAILRSLRLIYNSSVSLPERKELLNELECGCKYSLDMITMLQNTYTNNITIPKITTTSTSFLSAIARAINNITDKAKEKDLRFIYRILPCSVNIDSESLLSVLNIIMAEITENAKEHTEILCLTKKSKNKCMLNIKYRNKYSEGKFGNDLNFSTVGHGIKIRFCKNLLMSFGGSIKIKRHGNRSTILTIELNLKKENLFINLLTASLLQPSEQIQIMEL